MARIANYTRVIKSGSGSVIKETVPFTEYHASEAQTVLHDDGLAEVPAINLIKSWNMRGSLGGWPKYSYFVETDDGEIIGEGADENELTD